MKKIRKWMRVFHRDLGYLFTGIIMIYAISGFLLNHFSPREINYSDEQTELVIGESLSQSELQVVMEKQFPDLEVKKYKKNSKGFKLYINGGSASYVSSTGNLNVIKFERNTLLYYMNRLHFNSLKYWTYIADAFAFALIFFAISGLVIVKGKNGFLKRGIYFTIIGILIPLIICLLN